eukprot:37489-Alexandrium_andersonii.AAC.1
MEVGVGSGPAWKRRSVRGRRAAPCPGGRRRTLGAAGGRPAVPPPCPSGPPDPGGRRLSSS